MKKVHIIGAGMAGCEAAWQLVQRGISVILHEMKPQKFSPAHKKEGFAELVCSNSLKAERTDSAAGLLKTEMELLGSLLVPCAKQCRVAAGGALAVDRDLFSDLVTEKIKKHPQITVEYGEVTQLPSDGICIVAGGPLISEGLSDTIQKMFGQQLSFYDAAAPIVSADSIDMESAFFASRYDKGGDDAYINCPMNKEEYEAFYEALLSAESAPLHGFDQRPNVYEGCMPIEIMAKRGGDTIRFGPLKPVGLRDPHTGRRPWAVVQLRRENAAGTLYNMVGFQTNLKFGEQKRVFGMIPALKNAEFMRYGVMHRNTFLDSPKVLLGTFQTKQNPELFFGGQITGVEGYMESAASGLMAGRNAAHLILEEPLEILPEDTMIGALSRYISGAVTDNFQPMGANFGILPCLAQEIRDKKARYAALAKRSLKHWNREDLVVISEKSEKA